MFTNVWDIETPLFRQRSERMDATTFRMERELLAPSPFDLLQVTGPYWLLMVSNNDPEWISVIRDGIDVKLKARVTSFLPPFSIVKWRLLAGVHPVSYVLSYTELEPQFLLKGPVSFVAENRPLPCEKKAVEEFLASHSGRAISIAPSSHVDTDILFLKEYIDRHYTAPFRLSDLARQLNRSSTVLGRQFRRAYGTTPANYRVKLRCFSAMYQLQSRDLPVVLCAADVGYNNIGLFNRQFRSQLKTKPSVFRPSSAPNRSHI